MSPNVGAGIRVHVGLPGSGKTYAIKRELFQHLRAGNPAIVVDRMREWANVPPDIAPIAGICSTVEEAKEALERGARLAVVQPPLNEGETAVEQAAQWAVEFPGLAGLAIPEAHRAIPKRGAGYWVGMATTEWRHHNVAMWCDTQRFSLLNTDLVEIARTPPHGALRLFAIAGKNDLKAVRELGDEELVDAVVECARRYDEGEPGWHVRLGIVARPPYRLVRE